MPGDKERRIWKSDSPPLGRRDSLVLWCDRDGNLRIIGEQGEDLIVQTTPAPAREGEARE